MKYLEKYGFTKEEIEKFTSELANNMLEAMEVNKKLIQVNLAYLNELGVKNIKELFLGYYELFLMDHSNFAEIFNKYDREDLVEKLNKNAAIIEYL